MKGLKVEFPLERPSYYPMQTAIKFPIITNGHRVQCYIEVSALAENFEDFQEGQGMAAFYNHRSEIESIVEAMVENGYVNPDGDLFIHNRDFMLFRENVKR